MQPGAVHMQLGKTHLQLSRPHMQQNNGPARQMHRHIGVDPQAAGRCGCARCELHRPALFQLTSSVQAPISCQTGNPTGQMAQTVSDTPSASPTAGAQ